MGMFDYLRCELPIPDRNLEFQTKDTAEWCSMDLFIIRPDGTLVKSGTDSEGDEEVIAFDGDIHFYKYSVEAKKMTDYRATFRRGACQEIHVLDSDDGLWERVWRAA